MTEHVRHSQLRCGRTVKSPRRQLETLRRRDGRQKPFADQLPHTPAAAHVMAAEAQIRAVGKHSIRNMRLPLRSNVLSSAATRNEHT